MISAVYSRFSGVLSGGSVWTDTHVYTRLLASEARVEAVASPTGSSGLQVLPADT